MENTIENIKKSEKEYAQMLEEIGLTPEEVMSDKYAYLDEELGLNGED